MQKRYDLSAPLPSTIDQEHFDDNVSTTENPLASRGKSDSFDTEHISNPFENKQLSSSSYSTQSQQKSHEMLTEFSTLSAQMARKEIIETADKDNLTAVAENIRHLSSKHHEYIETDYEKMVEAIQEGSLCPGVIFYHESTPIDDILPDNQSAVYVTSHQTTENQSPGFRNSDEGDDVGDLRASLIEIKEKAQQNYGDKSKELERFYNILKVADQNNSGIVKSEDSVDNKNDSDDNNSQSTVTSSVDRDAGGEDGRYLSRPVTTRLETGRVESLSQFELQSFQPSTSSTSSSNNTRLSVSENNMISLKGSTAYIYAVTIWMWHHLEAMPKLLDKQRASIVKPSTVKLPYRLLPGQWVWKTYKQRVVKFRRLYEAIWIEKNYNSMEIAIMFLSWVSRKVSHGQNRVTEWTNPRILRRFLTFFLFLLVVLDVMLFGAFSVIFFCIYDKTGCDNQTGFYVLLLFWPFALIMAPLCGIKCVILTPLGQLARRYRCWSSYVNITTVGLVSIYLNFFEDTPRYYLFMVVAVVISRFCQHFLIDIYIETQENKRASRGWDGLFTCVTHSEYDFH